jgi:RNA-binding protein
MPRVQGVSGQDHHRRLPPTRTQAHGIETVREEITKQTRALAALKPVAMLAITPTQRRELRAKAHHLHPVVIVGHHGLTAAVLHEIDVNLLAHELIKVRVFSEDREQREVMLQRICATLDAASVQHIGRLLVLWRPAPEKASALPEPTATHAGRRDRGAKSGTGRKANTMAKITPQARRPRSPLARTTARPAPRAPSSKTRQPSVQAARRRRQGG